MKFTLEIKLANNTMAKLESVTEKSKEDFSIADYEKIIEVEHFLERLFDHRFYIFTKEGR